MLIKNPRLVFVPKYNGSLVYNADIEWKNGAIPAREVMKFRPKAQASRTSPSVYSGIWIVIIELTASILSWTSPKISETQVKVAAEVLLSCIVSKTAGIACFWELPAQFIKTASSIDIICVPFQCRHSKLKTFVFIWLFYRTFIYINFFNDI